jgi:tetratricopeptide (TPR) repeat protein
VILAGLAALAHGAPPLPTYEQVLARDAWRRVNGRLEAGCAFDPRLGGVACAEGTTAGVVAAVEAFSSTLFPDGPLSYLAGLASRYAGDRAEAERWYRAALALDPTLAEAWYDLGELLLADGRTAEAREAFTEVAARVSTGPTAWLGPWRLAEVAAAEHDAQAFEAHLHDALRRGFTFRQIAGLPNWKAYYADPALHSTLVALLAVYADPSIEASLRP